MSTLMRELGIHCLTKVERIELALKVWENMGDDRPSCLAEAQLAELARRDAELDADPNMAMTWKEIRANIERGRT